MKPDPLISYKTDKTVKTESKPVQQQRKQLIDNEKKTDNFINSNNDENIQIIKSKKVQATPLKVKVTKQQNEIDSLKAQLLKLQLENERLKSQSQSQSNSISPTNEQEQDLVKKNISFNESVNILDIDTEKNSKLNDKVSIMRSNRNSTPYKPKSFFKSNIDKENQENIKQETKQSRGSYRITPIPIRKGQKKITFKSRLQSINDEANNESINESRESSVNLSFNLGQAPSSTTSTPSFLKGTSPDITRIGSDLTETGNGASNFVSPILTPDKTSKQNPKPFLFSWNKK